jgi:hypothetical protein
MGTDWRVHLLDGPFDGSRNDLLAPAPLAEPPTYVEVFICPCCDRIAVLDPIDPRTTELLAHGAAPGVMYVLEQVARVPTRWAHYRWIEAAVSMVDVEEEAAGC